MTRMSLIAALVLAATAAGAQQLDVEFEIVQDGQAGHVLIDAAAQLAALLVCVVRRFARHVRVQLVSRPNARTATM